MPCQRATVMAGSGATMRQTPTHVLLLWGSHERPPSCTWMFAEAAFSAAKGRKRPGVAPWQRMEQTSAHPDGGLLLSAEGGSS